MGMLSNKYWTNAEVNKRVIAKSIKRCELGDVREMDRTADANGEPAKGPKSKVLVNLTLAEAAKTTDGDDLRAGFPTVITINEWEGREDEAKAKIKELAIAVLGMDRKTKDNVAAAVDNAGGWAALKGRPLLVEFDVKNGYQETRSFNRIPATT